MPKSNRPCLLLAALAYAVCFLTTAPLAAEEPEYQTAEEKRAAVRAARAWDPADGQAAVDRLRAEVGLKPGEPWVDQVEMLKAVARKANSLEEFAYFQYGEPTTLEYWGDQRVVMRADRRLLTNRKVSAMLQKLKDLGPRYVELVVDPGLVSRLDDFVKFAKSRKHRPKDPWRARAAYDKKLGSTVFHRALWLDPPEIEFIKKHGMYAGLLRQLMGLQEPEPTRGHVAKTPLQDLANHKGGTYSSIFQRHQTFTGTDSSLFLSFGKSPKVGLGVLHALSKRPDFMNYLYKPRSVPVLYRVTVPKLSLIKRFDNPILPQRDVRGSFSLEMPNGKVYQGVQSNDYESMTLFALTPRQIRRVGHPYLGLLKREQARQIKKRRTRNRRR